MIREQDLKINWLGGRRSRLTRAKDLSFRSNDRLEALAVSCTSCAANTHNPDSSTRESQPWVPGAIGVPQRRIPPREPLNGMVSTKGHAKVETVANVLVGTLEQIEVKHIFASIGA